MTDDIDSFRGDYYFLSNFFPYEMVVEGKPFPTNEHFFQAGKAPTEEWYEAVRKAPTARDSKHIGHDFQAREGWDDLRNDHMLKGLRIKFAIPELREKLLATGDRTLVEGNRWHDQYWGRCDCPNHGGEGLNWLGRLLMQVRTEIREGR